MSPIVRNSLSRGRKGMKEARFIFDVCSYLIDA